MKARTLLKPIILAVLTLALAGAIAPQAYAVLDYYVPNYGTPHGYYATIGSSGGTIEAELFNKDNVTTRRPVIDTTNSGNNWTGYYAYTPGNQGNEHYYREDESTTDVDVYNGGGSTDFYIRTSIYEEPGDPDDPNVPDLLVRNPAPYQDGPVWLPTEWVNYRFYVETAGWYQVKYYGKSSGSGDFITNTLIDDDDYPGDISFSAANFELKAGPKVYLRAGDHNIEVVMQPIWYPPYGQLHGLCLDYIQFDRLQGGSVPELPSAAPRLITDLTFSYPDKVIAEAVVTDTQWGATPNSNPDTDDDGLAIQDAMDVVANNGGGTVFIPAGQYRIEGTLNVPANVTLRGEWAPPIDPDGTTGDGSGAGTILKATYYDIPSGDWDTTPFITCNGGVIKYLSIWYPSQTIPTSGSWIPTEYGWTIQSDIGTCAYIFNVTLYNSYKGIDQFGDSHDLYITALHTGLRQYGCGGGAQAYNVWVQNAIWKEAAAPINSTAMSQAKKDLLDDYTNDNLVGWFQSRHDASCNYNINVEEPDGSRTANIGILARQYWGDWSDTTDDDLIPHHTFAGMNVKADMVGVGKVNQNEVPFNLSLFVPEDKTYSFSYDRAKYPYTTAQQYYWKPTSNNFYNVKDYGAVGDGALLAGSDDTDAIQTALYNAGTAGGGTVYLPPGQYVVSEPLTVPAGVELRGSGPFWWYTDSCTILVCCGAPNVDEYDDEPFITLKSDGTTGSGVSNFSIIYPVQGYAGTAYSQSPQDLPQVEPYPATISGGAYQQSGKRVWAKEMFAYNAYDFVDFSANQCDEHLISGAIGGALHCFSNVGGGSNDGVIEYVGGSSSILASGYTMRSCSAFSPRAYEALFSYVSLENNIWACKFGTCYDEKVFGLMVCGATTGLYFYDDGGVGCRGADIWHVGNDGNNSPGAAVVCEKGGTNGYPINLYDVEYNRGDDNSPWIRTGTAFTGTLNMYTGQSSSFVPTVPIDWDIQYGTVNVYSEKPVSYGKPVWAYSQYSSSYLVECINDGITKLSAGGNGWIGNAMDALLNPDAHWVTIDLGQPTDVSRWVIYNAGFTGAEEEYDTGIADFETSTDGVTWTPRASLDSYHRWGYWDDSVPPQWVGFFNCNIWEDVIGPTSDPASRIAGGSILARYVRLNIPQGTQTGYYDDYARIVEFLVHARNDKTGWQFSNGSTDTDRHEGWSAQAGCTTTIESFGSHGTVGGAAPVPPYGYTKRLVLNTSATDPAIQSADNLSVNAHRFNGIKIRLMNLSSCTSIKVQYITQVDTAWDTAKQFTITNVTADLHSYKEYSASFSSWAGAIKQLRLTFTGAGSSKIIKLASICLQDSASDPLAAAGKYDAFWDYTDGIAAGYDASLGADGQAVNSQGYRGWKYQYRRGTSYPDLDTKYNDVNQNPTGMMWQLASHNVFVCADWMLPDYYSNDYSDAVRTWVAPADGTIRITGDPTFGCWGQGVYVSIRKGTGADNTRTQVWPASSPQLLNSANPTLATPINFTTSVTKGQEITFIVKASSSTATDDWTTWSPVIQYE